MHVPAISWVHPAGRLPGLEPPQWRPAHSHPRRLPFLGQDGGAPAHLVGGAHRRRAARLPGHGRRAFPRLPHRLLPDPAAAGRCQLRLVAAVCGQQPRARALQSRVLGRCVPSVRDRHPSRAPLPALAHALARHPRRTVRALVALRLALSVDHAADTHHARLDRALAHRAAAEGAVRRYALRRQGFHLQRARRTPLQALLAGVVLGHRPLHRHARRHLRSSSASTCRAACPDRRGSPARRGR